MSHHKTKDVAEQLRDAASRGAFLTHYTLALAAAVEIERLLKRIEDLELEHEYEVREIMDRVQ